MCHCRRQEMESSWTRKAFCSPAHRLPAVYVPLNQFHFHSPSETMVDGIHYPLEMHIVHKKFQQPGNSSSGLVAATVVAIFFKVDDSKPSPMFDQILEGPLQENSFLNSSEQEEYEETDGSDQFSLQSELFGVIGTSNYWAFNGSLTTPPCSEKINWRVMAKPSTISSSQLAIFLNALAIRQGGFSRGGDNRDTQPLNSRVVLSSFATSGPTGATASDALVRARWCLVSAVPLLALLAAYL